MSDYIHVTTEDRVRTVTIDRPKAKNALTPDMYTAISGALKSAEDNPKVRVVLIQGKGGTFSAGNDIKSFVSDVPKRWQDSQAFQLAFTLAAFNKPMVAAVNGFAVGFGATMLLHCDLVYAAEGATLLFPFVDLGIVPEAGSSELLPRLVGHQRAAELLLLGDGVDAETARDLGLVNEVLPPDQLHEAALERAKRLAAKPPATLRRARALLKGPDQEHLRKVMTREAEEFFRALEGQEAQEAAQAFLAGRRPDFSKFE